MNNQNIKLTYALAIAVAGAGCLFSPQLGVIIFGLVLLVISLAIMAKAWSMG